MLGRSLSLSITLVSLLLMGLISAGVHYMSRKIARGPDYSVGVYVSDMLANISICSKNCVEIPKAKDMLPVTPAGWTSRELADTDYELVTGVKRPEKKVNPDDPFAPQNLGAAGLLSLAMAKSMVGSGVDRRDMTYIKGDEVVIVTLIYKKSALLNGIGGDQLAMMFEIQQMSERTTPYVRADDLVFHLYAKPEPGGARRFVAHMGSQIDITLFTNAKDESIAEILKGLDIAGLKMMLADHPSNADVAPAADAVDPAQQPVDSGAGGGWMARLGLGGGTASPAPEAAATAGTPPPEAGFKPACSGDKGFKHCAVTGD